MLVTPYPMPREVGTTDRTERPTPETPDEGPHRAFSGRPTLYRLICLYTMAVALALTIAGSISAQAPNVSTPLPNTTQEQGWLLFDDRTGTAMHLDEEQVQKLRDVDGSYQKRYTALGNTPWTNEGYAALSDSRETDYRTILTPAQFEFWNQTYGRGRPGLPQPVKADATGLSTNPDALKSQH